MLVSLPRYAPFHNDHKKLLLSDIEINFIEPRSILKRLCMWQVEVVNAKAWFPLDRNAIVESHDSNIF